LAVYNNRGEAYQWSNQYDLAIKDYDAALEIDPTDVRALYGRGASFLATRQYEQSIADADRLIAMGRKANVAAYQLKCAALAGLGRFDEAIGSCSEQLKPFANPVFLIDRANVYLRAGQYDRAIEDFDAVLKNNAHDVGAVLGLGKAMFAQKDYAAALQEFDRAYRIANDNGTRAFALNQRGLANEALGQRLAAISDFRQALKAQPDLTESKDGLRRLGASPTPLSEKQWWKVW